MIWFLLVLHLVGCAVLTAGAGRLGRAGLLIGAIPPALTAAWAVTQVGASEPATAELTWVAGLDLEFAFRLDAFAVLMTLLVSGIGALVFVYAFGYFSPGAARVGPFAATLLSFSTAMLGLVWADSVWTLFIFWELTSVTSFLLVGHKNTDESVLAAARRALMITGVGGLSLLAGLLILASRAGTPYLSELTPVPASTAASVAAVLIMAGAATKSAQVPFHVWLPGAMAAPTPVSAYLHSATMVKAGVVLVAVAGPALGDIAIWKSLGLGLGVLTTLWGAIGALRHRDAKLILAWGTVSQLGVMITLLSAGSSKATFAGVAMLGTHALFKAALFLVVGEIDIRTGTRNIDELGGLARSMPVAFAVAVAAGLSMAGVPPLLGFASKEAAVEAVLTLSGREAIVAGVGIIGGSVLTVAYTLRFLVATFGSRPDGGVTPVKPIRPAMSAPAVILGAAGLVAFAVLGPVDDVVRDAAIVIDPGAEVYKLLRWPGFTTGLAISAAVIGGGAVVGYALSGHKQEAPDAVGARWADFTLDQTVAFGKDVCAKVQHGSLPVYMTTMAATVVVSTLPFLSSAETGHLELWDTPLQAVVAVIVIVAAVAAASLDTRLGAALALGAVGIGISALFVIHGAPDLVLTQLLVETVVVVGFVVGFLHLSPKFPPVGEQWRRVRLAIAAFGGVAVMVALAIAGSVPNVRPPVADLVAGAVDDGGGNNVVNVILTDIRGLDTIGEVVVLATAAVGILALARARADSVDTGDSAS